MGIFIVISNNIQMESFKEHFKVFFNSFWPCSVRKNYDFFRQFSPWFSKAFGNFEKTIDTSWIPWITFLSPPSFPVSDVSLGNLDRARTLSWTPAITALLVFNVSNQILSYLEDFDAILSYLTFLSPIRPKYTFINRSPYYMSFDTELLSKHFEENSSFAFLRYF